MQYLNFQKFDYSNFPKIDNSNIKLLWHTDYSDGPLSGILEFNGKKLRFQVCDESLNYQRGYPF